MQISPLNISFVSFSSTNSRRTLLDSLLRNGFKNINSIDSNKWLKNKFKNRHELLVIQMDQPTKWHKSIIDTLKFTSKFSILAILDKSNLAANEDLLQHCDEFITWPCNDSELAIRINKISPPATSHCNNKKLIEDFLPLNLIGQSDIFLNALNNTKKIAACQAPVLIEGDTGTGKELFAHAVHYMSVRQDAPFIPINCGSLPDQLFDNEFFGHEKGAFTDAKSKHKGLIHKAENGTIFLDEIEALSLKAQVSLLRFLQDYTYRSLGSSVIKKANVRIIAASNQSLKKLVAENKFREDLYYRLNIMQLQIPSLKERGNDMELLTNHFIKKYNQQYDQNKFEIHPIMFSWMKAHSWPGNIRELENTLHRAYLLSDGDKIIDPSLAIQNDISINPDSNSHELTFNDAKHNAISKFEKNYLIKLMNKSAGNVTLAAKISGKERRAIGKLLKKYELK